MIQDSCSHVIQVICGPLGECDSMKTETLGLLMALQELTKMKACKTIIEDDS